MMYPTKQALQIRQQYVSKQQIVLSQQQQELESRLALLAVEDMAINYLIELHDLVDAKKEVKRATENIDIDFLPNGELQKIGEENE